MGPLRVNLGEAGTSTVATALSRTGLVLDLGAVVARVRSNVPALASPFAAAYRYHGLKTYADFVDLHLLIERQHGPRRWLQPQAIFRCDGVVPFEPFPASHALPLIEWGANWLIGQRLNDLLLLHAGAVERDGFALVMPATPGSGKSTLTAALALRGWRVLSDEFAAFDPEYCAFRPVLKPIALKNASIDVIRAFAPDAPIGQAFPKTRKGTVAHLASSPDAVARRHEPAHPGLFVLPRWQAGSKTRLRPLEPRVLFGALAFNAFNYRLLGSTAFAAVISLARRPAWQLVYSDLEDAVDAIGRLWRDEILPTELSACPQPA